MQSNVFLLLFNLLLCFFLVEKCNENVAQNETNTTIESPTVNETTNVPSNDVSLPIFYVGSGGGFTGKVTAYQVNPDGKVWEINTLKEDTTFLKQLIDSDLAEIKAAYQAAGLSAIDFNVPGNLYYYIELVSEDSREPSHRITWGHHSKKPPVVVQSFYTKVLQIIKKPVNK